MNGGINYWIEQIEKLKPEMMELEIDYLKLREQLIGENKKPFLGIKSFEAQIRTKKKQLRKHLAALRTRVKFVLKWQEQRAYLENIIQLEEENISKFKIELTNAKTAYAVDKDKDFYSNMEIITQHPKAIKEAERKYSLYLQSLQNHLRTKPRESVKLAEEALKYLDGVELELEDIAEIRKNDVEALVNSHLIGDLTEVFQTAMTNKTASEKKYAFDVNEIQTPNPMNALKGICHKAKGEVK